LLFLVSPDGWYFQGDAFYKYFSVNKTWTEAKAYCQAIDAELAYIPDEEHNEFVYRNLLQEIKQGNGTSVLIQTSYFKNIYSSLLLSISPKLFAVLVIVTASS